MVLMPEWLWLCLLLGVWVMVLVLVDSYGGDGK